ncbi:hypothetical protein FHL15_000958 [Xylaria flabelliformis]|uniref:Uncharacterized protein n=1 Tax=Xylaria flabelliformis TaxID=2512241 RepID=A0A553IDP9_9PEZI|nr:hypothetical protein FHL15_000958 [Xylaria flabelliformis]
MASFTNVDAPGAYPATPLEEPTSQTQHSNLQRQGDLNQTTPRSLEHDLNSSRERGSDKPGFMTGAYSRVGTQPSAPTQNAKNANYTYDDIASQSPYGEDTRLPNPATDLAAKTPASAPAENTAINSINKTSIHNHGGDHNKIQSGLRGSTHTEHTEPYWGDIPFGTGVYNGVTGHGSNETATEGSLHDQHATSTNTGIYNGVTGHGSKQSTRPESSKYDEGITTTDSADQQRAFPLGHNGSTTAATTKPNDMSEHKRDSRFQEGFASAGAAAAGGYAAHEYLYKDYDRNAKSTNDKLSGEKPNQLGQNTPDVFSQTRSQERQDTLNKHEGREQSLPHRPFVAAPVPDTQEKTLDRQPLDTENVNKHQKKDDSNFAKSAATAAFAGAGAYGLDKNAHRDSTKEHPSKSENMVSQSTAREPVRSDALPTHAENETKHHKMEDSSFEKYGAAAAAAGAGAYGANKYANRDSAKETSPVTENNTSRSTAREPTRNNEQVVGDNSRAQPEYNVLSDGTPSGIATNSAHQSGNVVHSTASQSERHNVTSDRTSASETRSTGRISSDSSHGGLYNVLSSGTPSGINVEHIRAEKEHHHEPEHKQHSAANKYLSNVSTPPSSSRTAAAAERNPTAALENTSLPAEQAVNKAPEQLPSAGNKISTGSGYTSGHQMTHKCTNCGQEDDISHYMRV